MVLHRHGDMAMQHTGQNLLLTTQRKEAKIQTSKHSEKGVRHLLLMKWPPLLLPPLRQQLRRLEDAKLHHGNREQLFRRHLHPLLRLAPLLLHHQPHMREKPFLHGPNRLTPEVV